MHVRLNGDSKFAVGVNVRCLVLSLPCEIPATARLMTAAIGSSSPGNPELGKQFRKHVHNQLLIPLATVWSAVLKKLRSALCFCHFMTIYLSGVVFFKSRCILLAPVVSQLSDSLYFFNRHPDASKIKRSLTASWHSVIRFQIWLLSLCSAHACSAFHLTALKGSKSETLS